MCTSVRLCMRARLALVLIALAFSGSLLAERVKKVSACSRSGCNLFESIRRQNSLRSASTALPGDVV